MGAGDSKVVNSLNGFCYPNFSFWPASDSESRNDNDRVDVTLCFQDTAVFYSIVIVFWILAITRFLFAGNVNIPAVPLNIINVAKCVICGLIAIPAVCDIVHSITSDTEAPFLFITPPVLIFAMVVAAICTVHERRIGVRSSGLMIIFWIAMVVYGTVKLRTYILLGMDGYHDNFRFATFITEYVLFVIQLLLTLLLEPPSLYHSYRGEDREPCPEKSAHFFSKITWWWMNGQFWRGYRRALTYNDLCDLNYEEKSRSIVPKFQSDWDKQLRKAGIVFNQRDADGIAVNVRRGEPSLLMALARSFGFTFSLAIFFKLANDLLSFVSPQLLKLMIAYVKGHSDEDAWKGYAYTFLMFLAAVIQSLCIHTYFHLCFRVGMRIRTAIIATVYAKALRLSNTARHNSTVGEIVNLMSVDAQRLMDLATYFHYLWSGPFQIMLSLIFLYQTMGASVFAGFGVMVLLIPVNGGIAIISRKFQVKQMIKKDARIKLVNEVLNGIKVIKLYAWEIPFKRMIMGIREEELKVLKASQYLNAATAFTWTCAPFMVALVTFATYSLYYRNDPSMQLTAEKAFVALSLFNILRFPLSMLPMTVSMFVEATVSVKRLCKFFKEDELDPNSTDRREQPAGYGEESVSIQRGSFTWDTPERPTLENIDFKVYPGELVAVVGQVGAGKSSLMSALLGEMEKMNGNVLLKGRVAYVPQQAWIQNATVKDNILFSRPMHGILYDRTINACALAPDFDILPGGDMTEIGEKGINLSGGQKQRVSLARAVYQEADIYLLDDPLSAVDSHVGKHIFDKVIGPEGMLKSKVRVLVTHGLGFLPQCDKIVVMDKGKITEVGSYSELIDMDGAFAEFLRNYAAREENEEGDPMLNEYVEYEDELEGEGIDPVTAPVSDDPDSLGRKQGVMSHIAKRRARLKSSESELVGVDKFNKPELKRGTSRTELKRQLSKQTSIVSLIEDKDDGATENTKLIQEETVETGNVKLKVFLAYAKACTYLMSFLLIVFYILTNGASVGQNIWLAQWSSGSSKSLAENLGVYAALGVSQALLVLGASFFLAIGGILGSRKLHDEMLGTILRAPMAFFDTTPLGRILNRFSKDVYIIDEAIPRALRAFISTFFMVISTILVISIASPWFLAVIVPLLVLYYFIQRFYVATSRQLKRLESVTRSPIFSHFQESITGASTIRAYNRTEDFKQQSEQKVDFNQIAYYPGICANRWLAIRLEFVGNLIILFAALFATLQANYPQVLGRINPGLVGLSISYALQVTMALNWMVRMTSDLETNIVSVERTKEYAETTTEAPAVIDHNRPPRDWPIEGRIKFDHYSTRYRDGLDLVLKNISCNISGGQKVGIVGRTGAGKSSLTLALFRIIESASGAIYIDDINIAGFGLSDLRSRITIIPQDPVLFSGTLRINLDPFQSHSDDEIWRALETANLIRFVEGLPERLEYEIAEGGENLSVGQRQLVCLARALLRKTKVLVLDEATAAVDLETDDLIQKTIRKEFADSTVVTIAHRLNTIMDYDRIMVLDTGRIVEFDSPNALLEKKGTFYGMAQDAGIV